MDELSVWGPNAGPGSEAQVVAAFTAWLTGRGWTCAELKAYGDLPDIDARHRDGRHLIVEAKGVTKSAGTDVDIGYGQLLRRISQFPEAAFALVCAQQVLDKAQRVSSEVRHRLGIELYAVAPDDTVQHVTGPDSGEQPGY